MHAGNGPAEARKSGETDVLAPKPHRTTRRRAAARHAGAGQPDAHGPRGPHCRSCGPADRTWSAADRPAVQAGPSRSQPVMRLVTTRGGMITPGPRTAPAHPEPPGPKRLPQHLAEGALPDPGHQRIVGRKGHEYQRERECPAARARPGVVVRLAIRVPEDIALPGGEQHPRHGQISRWVAGSEVAEVDHGADTS